MATRQDAALGAANQMIGLMQQLKQFRQTAADFVKQYNSEAYNTTWNNMATAAQNADGSLGTADGSPNTAHPIDNRVASLTALNKAVSATMLIAGVTLLNDFANFVGNAAVSTAQRSQTIDDLAS